MKKILVTGDLVCDNNLVLPPGVPASYYDPLPATTRKTHPGGAAHLARIVQLACSDLATVDGPEPDAACQPTVAQSHALWEPFNRERDDKEQVWRIREFLGCQAGEAASSTTMDPAKPPEVLVIDDLNLGFRDSSDVVSLPLSATNVVLKMAPPLAQGPLWERLIQGAADRLTVVLPINALRGRHADLSRALSWDSVREELDKELSEGASSSDLARARRLVILVGDAGVAVYTRQVVAKTEKPAGELSPSPGASGTQPEQPDGGPRMKLERLVYDPDRLESDWHESHPGTTYGATSILTAAMVRHLLDSGTYPLFIAAARALSAIRESHRIGAGDVKLEKAGGALAALASFNPNAADEQIKTTLHPPDSWKPEPDVDPSHFRSTVSHALLRPPDGARGGLIDDVLGASPAAVLAAAVDVVLRGPDHVLASVPKARYGKFLTVDREEIERINELRRLIQAYRADEKDKRPLSIAVFGPPGCGKSFAIKELAEAIFGKGHAALEFNLSQFADREELHHAFQRVRDASIEGEIPLVFWDEFDCEDLRWLKEFLAPMQDRTFLAANTPHPLGKAIFVFAGGVNATCREFDCSAPGWIDRMLEVNPDRDAKKLREQFDDFRGRKGPDFISRLRAYMDIKGPNPVPGLTKDPARDDPDYVIRRAILLRSLIARHHPYLIERGSDRAAVSARVIRGFLLAKEYRHGARSMEAIVATSAVRETRFFGPASLPSPATLALHTTGEFKDGVFNADNLYPSEAILELIAEGGWRGWRAEKEAQGYKWGPVDYDDPDPAKGGTHPHLVPTYRDLTPEGRLANRDPAPYRWVMFAECGFGMRPRTDDDPGPLQPSDAERDDMAEREHKTWLRTHLPAAWDYAAEIQRALHLHTDIRPFKDLSPRQQALNYGIIDGIVDLLFERGWVLTKKEAGS